MQDVKKGGEALKKERSCTFGGPWDVEAIHRESRRTATGQKKALVVARPLHQGKSPGWRRRKAS